MFLLGIFSACADAHEHDDDHHDGGHGGHHDEGVLGPLSGATCPTDRTGLTYEAFGRDFMTMYCTRCHSTELTTPQARMNATPEHDFNVEPGVRAVHDHIDRMAASGPKATNVAMPPSEPRPSMEERVKLGQWLACEYGEAQ